MPFTAGVGSTDEVFATSFMAFKVVGYFFAV
jgi:hypothetical protein